MSELLKIAEEYGKTHVFDESDRNFRVDIVCSAMNTIPCYDRDLEGLVTNMLYSYVDYFIYTIRDVGIYEHNAIRLFCVHIYNTFARDIYVEALNIRNRSLASWAQKELTF